MNYPTIELYIDGRWKRTDGQPVLNPADETVLGTVSAATIADLDDAIAAADRGFNIWRKTSSDYSQCRPPYSGGREQHGSHHDAGAGQADRTGSTRNPARLRHHRMGCKRGVASVWPRNPQRRRNASYRAA